VAARVGVVVDVGLAIRAAPVQLEGQNVEAEPCGRETAPRQVRDDAQRGPGRQRGEEHRCHHAEDPLGAHRERKGIASAIRSFEL
jgi:hypothetical protein